MKCTANPAQPIAGLVSDLGSGTGYESGDEPCEYECGVWWGGQPILGL